MSIPHAFYLLGVAAGAFAVLESLKFTTKYLKPQTLANDMGILIVAVSAGVLLGYAFTEALLHIMPKTGFNYKRISDSNLENENNGGLIFEKKYFNFENNSQLKVPNMIGKNITLIIFAIASKSLNIIYFYFPFFVLNNSATLQIRGELIMHVALWIGFGGLVCSLIFLCGLSTKSTMIVSCLLKIVSLIATTIIINQSFPSSSIQIMLWIQFLFFGFGYSLPDLNILELTSLKYNEIILAIGYIVEMVFIGVIQYTTIVYPDFWFGYAKSLDLMLQHCIAFGIIFLVLIVATFIIMPSIYNKSLLATKNIVLMYGFKFFPSTKFNFVAENESENEAALRNL